MSLDVAACIHVRCVSWGSIHDEEAVFAYVPSQPTEELPHCGNKCPP